MPFKPHICYTVDDIEAAVEGMKSCRHHMMCHSGRAAFTFEDGIEVEYLQIAPGRAWFDDDVQ